MILLDFDGTVVDLWPRFHAVFCRLTGCDITLDRYRSAKQTIKRDESLALSLGAALPEDHFAQKAALLESRDMLELDRLLLPRDVLLDWARRHDIVILSRRRDAQSFAWELDRLGLSELASVCIDVPKVQWIAENVSQPAVIIGDDVRDMQAASLPHISAVMVLSGLCTREDFAAEVIPHEVVESLEQYIRRDTL